MFNFVSIAAHLWTLYSFLFIQILCKQNIAWGYLILSSPFSCEKFVCSSVKWKLSTGCLRKLWLKWALNLTQSLKINQHSNEWYTLVLVVNVMSINDLVHWILHICLVVIQYVDEALKIRRRNQEICKPKEPERLKFPSKIKEYR